MAVTTRYQRRVDPINVGNAERWLSMVAGGLLAVWGLKRRDPVGGTAALSAAALLHRGTTGHCQVYDSLGVNRNGRGKGASRPGTGSPGVGVIADRHSDTRRRLGGANGIHVETSVTINRPIQDVFRYWRNFENLPTFMRHLELVAVREMGISHWVAKGPAGTHVEWDARIINEIDNRLIGWQSLEGSSVASAGSVAFDATEQGTRVRVHLQYNPPAGKLGATVARWFGEDPNQTIHEDLLRYKQLLEDGAVPSVEGRLRGRRTTTMHPSARGSNTEGHWLRLGRRRVRSA